MKVKRLNENSLVARALAWLARAVFRHRRLFLYSQLALFVVSIFITAKYPRIKFDVSRDNLVGADKSYHRNFLRFKKEFPTQDDLVVVVESEDRDKNRQFVERLGARLEAETNLFHNVFYKGDLKMLGSKALLFVPEADLLELKKTLQGYRPFIRQFTQTTNLVSLFDMINTQFRTASREQNAENDSLVKALPALDRILKEAAGSLRRPGLPPSPGVSALFSGDDDADQQVYITFAKGSIYLVTAQAPTSELNDDAVARMRQLVDQTCLEVPGLNVGLTGEPVLETDEMTQSQIDTTVASVVSLVICSLIFIYGYQETGRPVKATLCLIVGLGYTMAFATLTVGHLNILTITFVPILIGLAIDYGVHLISRYEEELRHGRSEEAALTKALVFTGQGIFTGAFTTAGAFLAMGFTNFKGIQEMGIICGGGLLICLIPMMTMLPVLLLKGRQNVIDHDQGDADERRARIENFWLQRPVWVTCLTFGVCLLAATQIPKMFFDYDLRNMQSAGLPAVEYEKKLIQSADKSVLFAAVVATNLEQAITLEARLKQLPAVTNVESITRFLAEDQAHKLEIVGQVKQDLAGLDFAPPDLRPVDIYELSRTLYSFYGYLGAAWDEVHTDTNEQALATQLAAIRQTVGDLRKEMLSGNSNRLQAASLQLAAFQQALFQDVSETFHALQNQDNREPLRVQDLPDALRDRFVGVTGKYLLMVYPKKDVWQRENQEEFIRQVEPIYPDVTGTPIQLYHYTELLKESYVQAAHYSLVAIIILVLLHFRSPLCVALSLLPVGIGFLWLSGIMGWLNLPLNPANIMTLPLVIGIGVTNGIHILNRFAEEQTPNILARSTGKAVLVSGLTSIAGFGSLMLAKHRGIQSLGCVMSIGLATCMLAGLTFLPALLNLLTRWKMPSKRAGVLICVALAGSWGWELRGEESVHAGPLFERYELTLSPGQRTEAVGPLFYEEQRESQHTWAIPPLFSHAHDPDVELDEYDVLYPLLTYDRYGAQYRWQFLQLLSFAGGPTQTESARNRFNLFPIYFQQRSSNPAENYTAIGPFYGHLQQHFFRDDIFFVMFPAYSRTRKGEVVTENYLYPLFHLRHGPGLSGWQFWPLVGHEHKDVTTRTNGFGDLETIPGHDNRFVLWPIYSEARTGLGTDSAGWELTLLPAYSVSRSPQCDSTTVLWPFFTHIDNREKNYRQWNAPWPLIEIARGEGKTTTRFFPFFSLAHNTNLISNSYLWPLYKYNRIQAEPLDRKKTRVLFFLYSDTLTKNTETGASRRRVDLWPFFTHERDFHGNTRLQILAPLEPTVSGAHKIERDWSPLWSLWRAEKNPTTGTASQSLLWNLYRRDTTPAEKKVSAFFGLYQHRAGAQGKQLRLFYLPVSGSKTPAAPGH